MGNKLWKTIDEKSYEDFVREYLPVQLDDGGYEYRDMVLATKKYALMLERCLAEQYDMDMFDKNTALTKAAGKGHLGVVRYLIERFDVDVGFADRALVKATDNSHLEVARYLVECGAGAIIYFNIGTDLLIKAAMKGNLEIVQFLVGECNVDVNARNSCRETALMKAATSGHVDVVRYLTEVGVDLSAIYEDGCNALMEAASSGNLDVVQCLTECAVDVNATDNYGYTAIMRAARRGHIDTVRHLVHQKASMDIADNNGNTALMWAAGGGHIDIIRCIVDCGADVNICNIYGSTAVMLAAERGCTEAVRYLAGERDADVNVGDDNGDTALMLAVKGGHTEVVQYLVDGCNATVNTKNNDGTTALMWATERGHLEIVRDLIEQHGADMNVADNDGNTALMKAVMRKRIDVVQYLVSRNTNVDAINNRGETAFRLAYNYGYQNIQRILEPLDSLTPLQAGSATDNATSSSGKFCCLIPPAEVALIDQCEEGNIAGNEYHATWLDADVVVKFYIPDASFSSFEEEVNLWQKLRHPNVIKMYGACIAGSRLQFFIYEYASTISLIEFIEFKSATDDISIAWKFLYGAALGLGYLHERGVVHGNLRCCNILIGNDGLAKLSNFRLRDSIDRSGKIRIVDSIRWQSPEVVKGEQPSSASDVYSLGMCILEVSTIKVPWYDNNTDVMQKYKVRWNPPQNGYGEPRCPPGDARDLVWRMCCQDPNDRPSLFSIVYELERLSMNTASGSEAENLISFDEYELGKMSEAWQKVQGYMETCDSEEYCRAFDELTSVHKYLKSSTHPTLLAKFYALLTEFYQTIKMSPEQARIVRLSSTSATTTSFYALHWRTKSLLNTLQGSTDTLTWRNEQWQQHRDDQTKLFVSGISDAYLLLKDLKTVEERSAFLNVLKTEMENFQSKYTADQLETMKTTYDTIVSKIGTDDLLSLTPEWFIPWYELIIDEWSELGKGGFGSVCRGKWLDSDVVVKQVLLIGDKKGLSDYSYSSCSASLRAPTIQASNTKRVEALAMFRREVEIWFGLSHPHVIRLFGACHVGRPFFVCEYATNGTMIDYLRKHPGQLWTVLLGAALGVQYLHARGVVHGDLKGNNIVIGSDKKAKVTDFGLSSIAKNENDTPQISAALHWVAPECLPVVNANSAAQAKTGPTFASDVYSLGMCIVEALRVVENVEAVKRGSYYQPCLPWGSLNNIAVKHHAKQGKLPAKPKICENHEWDLVKRMCVFEPQQRIKISTVVDELMMLVAGIDQHIDSSPAVYGWMLNLTKESIAHRQSVNLDSVSKIITEAQKKLTKWRNMIIQSGLAFSLYYSLWEHFEHVRGQLNDSHSVKSKTIYYSLVVDANEATLNLENASPDMSFLTESTMRCYELERRLEKFCEAFFLVF